MMKYKEIDPNLTLIMFVQLEYCCHQRKRMTNQILRNSEFINIFNSTFDSFNSTFELVMLMLYLL